MNIRNFCIIAHIDHGKSTLADRFLEVTGTIPEREMRKQYLDTMDLEQERGITIKLQPVRMRWHGHELNLIDTPGHVDFQYEVSRSIAACEGAVLVVDATQGIEAQTLANLYLAMEYNLTIIPVINKIDLPAADVEKVTREIEHTLGIDRQEIIAVSAKEGTNVDRVLDAIIERVPSPTPPVSHETKALIFDSVYDSYRGVVSYVRVTEGKLEAKKQVYCLHTGAKFEVLEVGHFTPKYAADGSLSAGQIGYVVTGLKTTREAEVGDTIWQGDGDGKTAQPLPGYRRVTPFVFAGVYPVEGSDYGLLRDALEKLRLNDNALVFEPENNPALGNGFRVGFLGLLHLEIVQERLEREYNLVLIVTSPSVSYELIMTDGSMKKISNPSELPDRSFYRAIREPFLKVEIIAPTSYTGAVMELSQQSRGIYKTIEYLDETRVLLRYELPLAEIVVNFYDRLKNVTSGYASMNYEFLDYREEDLVRVDVLVAGDVIPSLAFICHRERAQNQGSSVVSKLKEVIPRAQFVISLQAAIGGKFIARENIPALRKDVTAKLYGGDITRKRKLLEKQKEGKKRLKQIGRVSLPQEAFLAILKRD